MFIKYTTTLMGLEMKRLALAAINNNPLKPNNEKI
jgi:hypothetical protein